MTLLCVAPRCRVPGWHAQDCDSDRCTGCLPNAAEIGNLCRADFDRTVDELAEIPALYARLDAAPGAGETGAIGRSPTDSRPPVRIDVLSEVGPGAPVVHDEFRDQHGDLPAAVQLDQLARDWAGYLDQDDRLPAPTVPALCRWLGARLDWAARHHPAVDEAVGEIWDIHRRLERLAVIDPQTWTGGLPTRCPACRTYSVSMVDGVAVCHHPDCMRVLTRRVVAS